jgi:hypothetical protein
MLQRVRLLSPTINLDVFTWEEAVTDAENARFDVVSPLILLDSLYRVVESLKAHSTLGWTR